MVEAAHGMAELSHFLQVKLLHSEYTEVKACVALPNCPPYQPRPHRRIRPQLTARGSRLCTLAFEAACGHRERVCPGLWHGHDPTRGSSWSGARCPWLSESQTPGWSWALGTQ